MMNTTFRLLREHGACVDRYRHLAKELGGILKYGRDTPIPIGQILEVNGLDDALWSLRAVPESQSDAAERIARRFICRSIRETPIGEGRTVWDLLTDERSRNAVEVAERYLEGKATPEELAVAESAARDAAGVVAWDAAWDAARAAVRAAAWAAGAAGAAIRAAMTSWEAWAGWAGWGTDSATMDIQKQILVDLLEGKE